MSTFAGTICRPATTVIDAQRILRLTAEELPDGLSGGLPEDIPQGEVDGRKCTQLTASRAEVGGAFVEKTLMLLNI